MLLLQAPLRDQGFSNTEPLLPCGEVRDSGLAIHGAFGAVSRDAAACICVLVHVTSDD